jgi:hypothetical protein
LGLDKEAELVEKGINEELGREMFEEKCPEFVISDSFEFERFSRKPDFGIAQSLFSHLSDRDARLCLSKLRQFVNDGHRLFVTFFEGDSSQNPTASHSHARFMYSREEMEAMGRECGWRPDYLGDWKHPRNQMMIRFVAE